ncbi:hypothetical protein [Kibdelosporangium philippinense]
MTSYLAARTITVEFYEQSAGTYDHYFTLSCRRRTSSGRSSR